MTWPFMLRSTHRREMTRAVEDFARNTAALEAALRAARATPPLISGPVFVQAADFVAERANSLGAMVAFHAAEGGILGTLAAMRAPNQDRTGSLVVVIGGPMDNADMRRFRDFFERFTQDLNAGQKVMRTLNQDNLGAEEEAP